MHSHGPAISRRGLLSIVSLFPASRLCGQRHDQTFSADVEVVQVFATVRTSKGAIVRDLTKDDFKLEEDGRAQTIRYFSRESDLPLTVGLVLDTSASMRTVLDEERSASSAFFDQVLREDRDLAFVIHFDSEVEILQDLTSSRLQLKSAWSELEVAAPRQLNPRNEPYPAGQHAVGGTSLYDALVPASDEIMKKPAGRKAIIVLSDGVDNTSRSTLAEAIVSTQKADAVVYTILIADERQPFQSPTGGGDMGKSRMPRRLPPPNRPGKEIMEQLARETGGGFFEISKKQPIEKTYEQIQAELRSQYSLGYKPDRTDAGAGYHRVHVSVLRKGSLVQARNGYFANR